MQITNGSSGSPDLDVPTFNSDRDRVWLGELMDCTVIGHHECDQHKQHTKSKPDIASYIYLYSTSEDTANASNALSVNCIWWPQALFDIHVVNTDHLYAKSPAICGVCFDNDKEVLLIVYS